MDVPVRFNDQAIATRVGIAAQVDITLLLNMKRIEHIQRVDDIIANCISMPRFWESGLVAVNEDADVWEIVVVLNNESEICICFSAFVLCCVQSNRGVVNNVNRMTPATTILVAELHEYFIQAYSGRYSSTQSVFSLLILPMTIIFAGVFGPVDDSASNTGNGSGGILRSVEVSPWTNFRCRTHIARTQQNARTRLCKARRIKKSHKRWKQKHPEGER